MNLYTRLVLRKRCLSYGKNLKVVGGGAILHFKLIWEKIYILLGMFFLSIIIFSVNIWLYGKNQVELTLFFFYIVTLMFLFFVFKKNFYYKDLINPNKMLLIGILVYLYFGPVFSYIYFGYDVNIRVLFILAIGILFFYFGTYILPVKINNNQVIRKKIGGRLWHNIIFVTYFIAILITVFYYLLSGTIPILADNAEMSRVAAKAGKGSLVLLSYTLFSVSLNLLQIYNYNIKKKTNMIFLLLAIILLLGIGYRGLPVQLILDYYLISLLIRKRSINVFKTFLIGCLLLAIVALLGFMRANDLTLNADMIRNLFIPIAWGLSVNYLNLKLLFEEIYSNGILFWGKGYLIDMQALLPGYRPNFGVVLKDYLNMDFRGEGVTTTIFGEFLVNFGVVGVLLGMFLLGFLLRILYIKFLSKQRTDLALLLMGLVSIKMLRFATGGIMPIFLYYILPTLVVFVSIYFISIMLRHNK
jgi:oligosaccharide repeat unit polymerase